MLWLGTSPYEPSVKFMLDTHEIGLLCQPASHNPKPGWIWAADNGCFTTGKFDPDRWLAWLGKPHPRSGCLFATVPDVVGDHEGTMSRWRVYRDRVHDLRYPVAFVAQDGATIHNIPWDEMDCLFVGGTDSFKQGMNSGIIAKEAKERSKWVHVGRVNSLKRLAYWQPLADSADGTFLAFGPAKNAPRVAEWVRALRSGVQERLM